jgi:hypothetical protein
MKRKKLKDQFVFWVAWSPSLFRDQEIKNNELFFTYK